MKKLTDNKKHKIALEMSIALENYGWQNVTVLCEHYCYECDCDYSDDEGKSFKYCPECGTELGSDPCNDDCYDNDKILFEAFEAGLKVYLKR